MTIFDVDHLATVVRDLPDGLHLDVRGQLSSDTAPALEALLHVLRDAGERHLVLDLREADVIGSIDDVLGRWVDARRGIDIRLD